MPNISLFNNLHILETLRMKSEEEPFLSSSHKGMVFSSYRKLHFNRATIVVAALTQLVLIAVYTLITIIVINTQAMKIRNSAYGNIGLC